MSVYAVGPRRRRRAGQDAGAKGLQFFKQLNDSGNFVPVDGRSGAAGAGHDADRHELGLQPARHARQVGRQSRDRRRRADRARCVAGVYVQAISAYAPHPNAAKLWMEHLYSDEGQLGWLKGYCHPIRFNDLAKNGKIPQELLDKLPPLRQTTRRRCSRRLTSRVPPRRKSAPTGMPSSAPIVK